MDGHLDWAEEGAVYDAEDGAVGHTEDGTVEGA